MNLWQPADGSDGKDFGAHGIFDDISHSSDPQVWASQHHGLITAAAAATAVTVAALAALLRRTRP